MNKHIRLLIENITDNIFNDPLFNNDDVYNVISNELFNYNIGDAYYIDKNLKAVCCGDSKQFKDKHKRFCLLDNIIETKWNTDYKFKYYADKLHALNDVMCYNLSYKSNKNLRLDEKGEYNTNIIKNNFDNIYKFPAVKHCINLHENAYLPAIDELKSFYYNLNKLKEKYEINEEDSYWSSTIAMDSIIYVLDMHLKMLDQYDSKSTASVLPFINLDI